MTRTLADMTPAEQDQCVCMWFELLGASCLVILASPDDPYDGYATVMVPGMAKTTYTPEGTLTPRFDLRRAWTPDGEPVELEEEWGEVAQGRAWLDGIHNTGRTHLPAGPVRRYVTDWEEA